jgi:F0F1-type ATP synthase delta subunit
MKPRYSRNSLVHYIVDSLESGISEAKLSRAVAAYLVEIGKVSDLDSLMRDVQEQRALKNGIVEVTVRSAHKLDPAQKKEIEDTAARRYKNTQRVTVHEVHDESVVGGANLSFANANLDVTIRGKLNQLREAIS